MAITLNPAAAHADLGPRAADLISAGPQLGASPYVVTVVDGASSAPHTWAYGQVCY